MEVPFNDFWKYLDTLLLESRLEIDRPKDSLHPRYPEMVYPLDYGFLAGTRAADGNGIDVWLGSSANKELTGIVCTVDLKKRDVEVKLLLGCNSEDVALIMAFLNAFLMRAVYLPRTKAFMEIDG